MEIKPKITTIPPLSDLPVTNAEFEVRLAKGPISIGVTGDGTYAELYSKDYIALIDSTASRLRLFVSTGGAWVEVDPSLFPQPPHPVSEIRHIAICFDQAARLAMAYEVSNNVYVYQWDPVAREYVVRGPFSGVDPVLIQDATIFYYPPDSDVLLFHLTVDRKTVVMRVQRQLYNIPHTVAAFDEEVILDQAIALPYYGEIVGSKVSNPEGTGFVLMTDVYPVYLWETAGVASITPPREWDYIPIVVVREWNEVGANGFVAPPTEWVYIPIVVIRSLAETGSSASVAAPISWDYIPMVIVKNLGTETALTGNVTPPTEWVYSLVVVVYNGGVDVALSAPVSPPVEWNYFV